MDIPTDPDHGQLWPKERELLHAMVLAHSPALVFEVGTWRGGGSTYQIATALRQIGQGMLVTCETDPNFFQEASTYYADWKDCVTILNQPSSTVISSFLSEQRYPDFIFFDGPDDADLALNDFLTLEPHLSPGSCFMMHDWDTNKGVLLRPYLESSPHWNIKHRLTSPESVGLVAAVKEEAASR